MNGRRFFHTVVLIAVLFSLFAQPGSVAQVKAAGNYALQFNGTNQYVTFGQATSTLGVTVFTLEAWVKRAAGGTSMTTGTGGLGTGTYPFAYPVITKGRGENETPANINTNYWLGIATTGVLAADFEDTVNGGNHPVVGTRTIPVGEWHHIAATYDGQTWRLYVDGVLDTTLTLASAFTPEATSIQHAALGSALTSAGAVGTSPGFFSGIIDEARVWNVVRTEAEIEGGLLTEAPTGAGLISRWDLNDGSALTALNAVSARPNGTLVNAPTWVAGFFTPPPPTAPGTLSATASAPDQINLTWADNSDNELSFEIDRSTNGGVSFTGLATTGANVPLYTDSLLAPLSEYCYRVKASNSGGSSAYSATACATTPAAQALDLGAGTAHVTFGNAAALGLANFTLEGWFRRDGAGTTANTGDGGFLGIPLITKGVGQAENSNVDMNYFLGIRGADNLICADFEEGVGGTSPGLNHPVCGTTVIANGAWYHVAATYDGTWKIYVNGELEATSQPINQPVRSDSIQHAGLGVALNSTGAASGHFDGVLDEVRIWDYARTQYQIQSKINQQINTPQTGLVGRWALDDGTADIITGSAGTTVGGRLANTGYAWTSGAPFNIPIENYPTPAPTGLNATPGIQQITLAWDASTEPDLAGYNVYRSLTPPVLPGNPLNPQLLTAPTFTDTSLTPGTRYYYAVTVVDVFDEESAFSSQISAIPDAPPPLEALALGSANAYVDLGNPAALQLQTFTLETWFKRIETGLTTYTGTGGVAAVPLISKGMAETETTATDVNYFLGIGNLAGNTTQVLVADFEECTVGLAGCPAGGTSGLNHPVVGTTPIAVDGVWHHAAVTYDGRVWKLYLDGTLETMLDLGGTRYPQFGSDQKAALGTALNSTGLPGASSGYGPGYFDGVLDEVRIWNTARTQSEILGSINARLAAPQADLVGRWGLDDASGSSAADTSGNAITGTITGSGYSWVTGAPFNITFDDTPPAAPTGLAEISGPGQVSLSWNANTETDLAGYNVYRSTTSPVTAGTPINGALVTSPSFMDGTATPGTTYFYAVAAVDGSGNQSGLSNEVASTPEAMPPDASALDLGGTSYVSFGDPAKLDLQQFTIETWFKRTGAGTPNTTGTNGFASAIPLVTHGAPEADGSVVDANWILAIDDTTDVIAADFEDMATGSNHPVAGVTPITDNVWHHAAATYDGTTWRLYLDGHLEATLAANATPRFDTTQKAALGTMLRTDGTTSHGRFMGALDEVRVWNYARSEAEILGTINSQLTGSASGLVARWSLIEGSGTAVGDSVAPAANGAVTGTGYSWVAGAPFNLAVDNAPAVPQLAAPANGATGISSPAALSVNVTDPEGDPLNVTFYGRPLQSAPGPDFSVVMIPDPQYYASDYPAIYNAQMQWVVDHKTENNTVYVASMGDNIDTTTSITQWTRADAAWDILDAGGVAYGVGTGNHDGAPSDTANFNTYFGPARYAGQPSYGGHYGADNDNFYALFESGSYKFIIVFIEYDKLMVELNHPVLVWANNLLQTHSDRRAIVISHSMLFGTDNAFTGQGTAIYNALKGNPNLFLISSGHLDIAARRTDTYNGSTVYTLRSDYQMVDSRQSGYLRILRFSPTENKIFVSTYSPTQDKTYPDTTDNNFSLDYNMGGNPFQLIGTAANVASGGTASVNWAGLTPSTAYEWYAVASDGLLSATSPAFNFTTAGINTAPVAVADAYSVAEDTTLTVAAPGVLGNDTDAQSNPLTAALVAGPQHGALALNTNGSFSYSPSANYSGPDSFTYKASDSLLNSATVTVNLTISPVNDAPVCLPVSITTNEDTYGLTATSCTDIDSASLVYSVASQAANGMGLIADATNLLYNPDLNYNGPDSFTYTANDGTADSNAATVTVTVTGVNDAPVANAQTVTTNEDTAKAITLTGTDVDNASLTYTVGSAPTHGALTGTAPALTYTPALNYNGPDSFTFTVSDGALTSLPVAVSITVTAVNDVPVANPQTVTTNEDTAKSITLTGTDVDGTTLTYAVVDGPAHGGLTGTAPALIYTPALNYNGPDSFTFTVSDGTITSAPAVVTINVTAVNDAPVANAQTVITNEDTAKAITLTGTDVDSATLGYNVVTAPAHGAITGDAPALTYTPAANYNGADSFTISVTDGTLTSAPAIVTINVTAVNDAPVADAQTVTTKEDTAKDITLTGSDIDSASLTYAVVDGPAHGAITGTAPALTYTPALDYNGPDSFTFTVSDGTITSAPAVVTINVIPDNDAPVANDQTVETGEDTPIAILLAGTDVDSASLTFSVVANPAHGSLTGTAPGLTYTPAPDYTGPDSFTFKANDGKLDSLTAELTLTVIPVNDAPAADAQTVATQEDTSKAITLTGSDVDNATLTYALVAGPSHGALTGTGAALTYTPAANYNGPDSFTFMTNDGTADSAVASVTINISAVDDTPTANAQTLSTAEDTALAISLTGADVETASLSFAITGAPAHGTLSGTGADITYTPAANYNGPDSFSFSASDGALTSAPAVVAITVTPVNDLPVAVDDLKITLENNAVTINVLANDTDADNDPLTVTEIGTPAKGEAKLNADSTVTYTPPAGFNGPVSFTYSITDGHEGNASATITITVSAVNDAPAAVDDADETSEDTLLTGASVLTNDSDPDLNPLTAVLVAGPLHGTLVLNADGTFDYTPTANWSGADSFTYKASDSALDSNIATVTLTVTPVNDAPTAVNDGWVINATSTPVSFNVLGNDFTAPDTGETLSISAASTPEHGVSAVASDGLSLTYLPTAGYLGTDSFTYTISDGGDVFASATVHLTVVSEDSIITDVAAGQPGTVTYTDPAGAVTTLEIPEGTVSQGITLVFTPLFNITPPAKIYFANHAFDVQAYRAGKILTGITFADPIIVTIEYTDLDVKLINESSLTVHHWINNQWAAGLNGVDSTTNHVGFPLSATGSYALFGDPAPVRLFMPMVTR